MLGRRGFLGGLCALPFIGIIKPKSDPRIFWATKVAKFTHYPMKLKQKLTTKYDLYVSPECYKEIQNWDLEPEYYI